MRTSSIFTTVIAVFIVLILSSTSHAAWITDGVPVCLSLGEQEQTAVTEDGIGGMFIVWSDSRDPVNTDIYVQRIDADGNLLLTDTGIPVCSAANLQSDPMIVPDGTGGAIIAWKDLRSGTSDLYAQKIDAYGSAQWTVDGIAVCTGEAGLTPGKMIPDGSGGAIIVWHDWRNSMNNVFAQRIGADGSVMWALNGIVVCSEDWNQDYPSLASDGAGGAIIAWEDNRARPGDIYAQRIDGTGAALWTANGVAVCLDTYANRPQVIPDGTGGAIIAWNDCRQLYSPYGCGIYAQRLSSSGSTYWAANGIVISDDYYSQQYCQVVSVGGGEAILVWEDLRNGADSDIYAQKIDNAGTVHWTANGIPVCTATNYQVGVRLVSDNAGGAVVTWEDHRAGASNTNIYVQRIFTDGGIYWTTDGNVVCSADGNQSAPVIATDGWNGAHVAWSDPRSGTTKVYAQRIDGMGNTVVATMLQAFSAAWSDKGITIEWTLSEIDEDARFIVSRASSPLEDYFELPSDGISRVGLSFSFIDNDYEPGTTYSYRVDLVSESSRVLLFETEPVETPAVTTTLFQNHPNPFNPSTTIRYYVPEQCRVTLAIYSVNGELVTRLYDGRRDEGTYTATWNGLDSKGIRMSSGVYFYRLRAGKKIFSRKMILLR